MTKLIQKYRGAEIYKVEAGYYWTGFGTEEGYYETIEEARAAIDSMAGER
jgi:hypothetical protein